MPILQNQFGKQEFNKEVVCMRKLLALVLTFVFLILLVGCQDAKSGETNTVLKAWTGEYSKSRMKSAIRKYKNNYTNIVVEKDGESTFSFETDFEVASCSVVCLSLVDDRDIDAELNGYIDLFLHTSHDSNTVTIPIDWWYSDDDSWVNNYTVWSYLVRVKDENGDSHYYYFRVDYSAYAE